jgi:hypothetical protein
MRYSQRALFFALLVSFLQPAISQCDPGTTGPNGGLCVSCVAGTYKNSTGFATCLDCAAGKYSAATGSTSCTDCGASTYSAGKLVVAPGLIGLSTIATSTLEAWTIAGVGVWKVGEKGQSCETTCVTTHALLECKTLYPLSAPNQRLVFAHLGYSTATGYNHWYAANVSPEAPMITPFNNYLY